MKKQGTKLKCLIYLITLKGVEHKMRKEKSLFFFEGRTLSRFGAFVTSLIVNTKSLILFF
jgi:hypothetical protein